MPKHKAAQVFIQETIRDAKAERNMTFQDLSVALRNIGITQSATNLSTKVARGDMGAQLFLSLMIVMGHEAIRLDRLILRREKTSSKRSRSIKSRKSDEGPI